MDSRKFSGMVIPGANFYLWIITVLISVIGYFNVWVAIPGVILLLFLVLYNIRNSNHRKNEIIGYIENLTFNIDSATKDTLLNFPLPLVVVEKDGVIIWYNSLFSSIFEGESLLENSIYSFVTELHTEELGQEGGKIEKRVTINGKYYNLLGNFVRTEDKDSGGKCILMLYLIDITRQVELEKVYKEEKKIISVIIIDNYDELMMNTDDDKRPLILAEIEKKVNQWMSYTGGILKKFERDKYLFIFEDKYLEGILEKKFEVLDTVKEISVSNKIPVTLSIGMGLNGKSLIEDFSFASTAIDIALGRGGDQAVIKEGENFSFYGGKTRELEKRTRVKARVMAHALRELIDQSNQVMIMGHENSDIDCLGASLGLYRICMSRGKEVHIVLNSSNPAIASILTKMEKYPEYQGIFMSHTEAADKIDRRTLLIVVDTHKPSFTEYPELLDYTDQIVVLDHHRRSTDFIQDAVLTYQETYASSTCELVTEIIQYVGDNIGLNPLEIEALYAGIVVDTKNFTFKTGVRTFDAASFLRRNGANTISVKQLFQNDLQTYTMRSDIVKNAEIVRENIAVSVCKSGTKNAQLISAQAADELLGLSGISAAFVLCSLGNNEITISGRSLGDINVQVILEKLGGGGHLSVAGAKILGMSIDEAKIKLKEAIEDYFNESKVN